MASEKIRSAETRTGAIDAAAAGKPAASSVPIFVERFDYVDQFATGTLLRVSSLSFLVTAAHVNRDAETVGARLFVNGNDRSRIFALPQKRVRLSAAASRPLDLTLWPITGRDLALFEGKHFLTLDDLWLETFPPSDEPYVLFGFPCVLSRPAGPACPTGSVTPTVFYMPKWNGDPGTLDGFDARHHFAFSARSTVDLTGEEGSANIPLDRYHGISGAAVWFVPGQGSRPLVVAIETCVHRKGVIQATSAYCLLDLMGSAYPALRDAIEAVYHARQR